MNRNQLGFWALLSLMVFVLLAVYTDIRRLETPTGEKYFDHYKAGQIDFSYPYTGARALIAGVNPYHNDRTEFTSPHFPLENVNGVIFKQLYPPGHLILLVPLAKVWGEDWSSAAQVWFHLLLAALCALAVFSWTLVRRITLQPLTPLWIVPIGVGLILNHSAELGLDRGQSDIITSAFCWGAVVCFLRRNVGIAIFLTVCGTSIKGYPLLFAVGLGLLALRRASWKRAIGGGVLGSLVMVLPGLQYMGDALQAARYRSDMFWSYYYNLGFRNVAYYFKPEWADGGRRILTAVALLIAVLAWFQARRAMSRGLQSSQALWLSIFATASLGVSIGYSALSVTYDLILVLPGVVVVVASQAQLGELIALPRWGKHLLGLALLSVTFLLIVGLLGSKSDPSHSVLPLTGFGLVLLFVVLFTLVLRALSRHNATLA